MDSAEIEQIPGEVDALVQALEEERYRHVAGIESAPTLTHLFAAHPHAAHKETVAALRDAGREELAGRVAALRADRAQAESEEVWRAADAAAAAVGPDGRASRATLDLCVRREPDRTRRLAFARAAAEALAPAASAREAAVERRARAAAEVGVIPDWNLVVEGDQALAASDDGYRDVLAFRARKDLGLTAEELTRADLLHLLAAPRWDGLFKPGMLPLAVKLTLEPLGLDAGRLRVDDAERPTKWPGVHVFGARICVRRRAGLGDWGDLLDGVGRALYGAAVPPHRRHPAAAAALGALLGGLVLEPRWLEERADVDRSHGEEVVRAAALRRLGMLRAAAAALRVATEVSRGLSGQSWRESYREAMTAATGAVWDGVRAAHDADAGGHAAFLAGAGRGARLRAAVRERFDEDWWRNPRTGPFLAGILAAGELPEDRGDTSPARATAALAHLIAGTR